MNNEQIADLSGLSETEVAALAGRLSTVRRQVEEAARLAGRDPQSVTLIGVSKFFPAALARAAVLLGLDNLGENRVQEMLAKQADLAAQGLFPAWHLIGTLQKNKVRSVVGHAALIHSVDSCELLAEISRRSLAAGLTTDVLLQVNTAREASKHGFDPDEMPELARTLGSVPGVRIRGLMTMAPLLPDPEDTRPVFAATRRLFEKLAESPLGSLEFNILSMGMSHDFVQAIACGSTHVRIGTAIFGPRPAPQREVQA